jgi:hypothetical protein
MTTIADRAIQLRDRIRRVRSAADQAQRLRELADLAEMSKASAATVRQWQQVAQLLGKVELPPNALPQASALQRLREQVSQAEAGTATDLQETIKQLSAVRETLEAAAAKLRAECQVSRVRLETEWRETAAAPTASLLPNEITALRACIAELAKLLQQDTPDLEQLRMVLARAAHYRTELRSVVASGSSELQAFLREAAAAQGVSLSRLSADVLEELAQKGLCDSFIIRVK